MFPCIMLIHQNPKIPRVEKLYLIVKNIILRLKHNLNLVAVFIDQLIFSNQVQVHWTVWALNRL